MRTVSFIRTMIAAAAAALVLGCGTAPVENGGGNGPAAGVFTVYYDADGLANNVVNDLAVDYFRSGLWVATQKGLSFFSFKDSTWTTYGTAQGLPNLKVTSVAVQLGTVWAGTMSGPAFFETGGFQDLPDPAVLPDKIVTVLAPMPEPDYSLWIGTRGGVARRTVSGEWKSWTTADDLSYNDITSIARDRAGVVWVGTRYGLDVFDGVRWTATTTGLPDPAVLGVYVDGSGSVWAGTAAGVMEFRGLQRLTYGTASGLPSPVVYEFVEDSTRMLWAATENGVARFDGVRWSKLALPDTVDGLPVYALASDVITKSIWIGTAGGLVRWRPTSQ